MTQAEQDKHDRELLHDLLNVDAGLTDWEVEFIDDLDNWTGSFTDRQREKLHSIHEKRIG